jgi:hypothetical protein
MARHQRQCGDLADEWRAGSAAFGDRKRSTHRLVDPTCGLDGETSSLRHFTVRARRTEGAGRFFLIQTRAMAMAVSGNWPGRVSIRRWGPRVRIATLEMIAAPGDLRERRWKWRGASRREAAERFDISGSSAVKWLHRWSESRSAVIELQPDMLIHARNCCVAAIVACHPATGNVNVMVLAVFLEVECTATTKT